MDMEKRLSQLEEVMADLNEEVFIYRQDLEKFRIVNVAMINFIRNLYESCQTMEDTELELEEVIKNLRENIRVFARDHNIRL